MLSEILYDYAVAERRADKLAMETGQRVAVVQFFEEGSDGFFRLASESDAYTIVEEEGTEWTAVQYVTGPMREDETQ